MGAMPIPTSLLVSVDTKYVLDALGRVSNITIDSIKKMSVKMQEEFLWKTSFLAHEEWRAENLGEIMTVDGSNNLNAFLTLELAGRIWYDVWIDRLKMLIGPAFAGFGQGAGLNQNVFINRVFDKKRREFAEKNILTDEGDLYEFVLHEENDVLGVVHGKCRDYDSGLAAALRQLLHNDPQGNLAFRMTRQVIVVNGGKCPIKW